MNYHQRHRPYPSKLQRHRPSTNIDLDLKIEALCQSCAAPKMRSQLLHEISQAYGAKQGQYFAFDSVPIMVAQVDPPMGVLDGLSGNARLEAILAWLKN